MWEDIFFVLSQFESTNVLVVGSIMTLSTCSSFIKKSNHPKTERRCYLLLTEFSWVLLQIPDGKVEQVWISTASPSLLPSSSPPSLFPSSSSPAEFPVVLVAISHGAHNSWLGWWGVRWGNHLHHPHHKRHLNINQLETKRMGKTKLSLTEQGLFSIKLK